MRSNFAKDYLNILLRYTLAVILAMFIKVLIIDMTPVNSTDGLIVFSPERKAKLEYTEEIVEKDFYEQTNVKGDTKPFKKPVFKDDKLNAFVENYIKDNSCESLSYNVYNMEEGKANIFLNCGNPSNMTYDYLNRKEIKFEDLLKDREKFIEVSKKLLKLKYPTFLVDDVLFDESSFDIRANEIRAYFKTNEYGLAPYTINNNEIRDLMNYAMHYDDAYENEVYTLDPAKPTIAFTFDDGPSTYDLKIIDALVDSHSTATFYMVGNRMNNFPDSIKKMIDNGMEVGNHTYDHRSLTGLSDAKVREEITKTNDVFYEMTGKNLVSMRPSYGNVNKRVRLQIGVPIVLWSIDTLDWKYRNAEKVYNVIMNESQDGDIVLMHSLYESTQQAVEMSLKDLYKKGFQVVSVGELARLKGKTLTAGSVIWNIK